MTRKENCGRGQRKAKLLFFFHLNTRRLSFSSKSTDADREKPSAGDREEANVHKHTRAYFSPRTAFKKNLCCTVVQVANIWISN